MDLPLLRSPAIPPGVRHGFTTRAGGVSGAPYDTLNVGGKWGDARAHVAENRRRVQQAAGVEAARFYTAAQVHGAAVTRVRAGDDAAEVARRPADGLYTDAAGVALAVFVADCLPVLIADPRTGAVAAVHAGWRGTVAGVLPAAVRALRDDLGARPADLRAAFGPAIGACCFEVGPEVVAAFEAAIPGARAAGVIVEPPPGAAPTRKPHVDLGRANRLLLERAGLDPAAIDVGAACTACDRARFYSFRRDGAGTGQHLGFIVHSAG